MDQHFIDKILKPYLVDLYNDLQIRSNQQEHIDKVTFIEYTKLPGIINDRLHQMFSNPDPRNVKQPNSGAEPNSAGIRP